MLHLHKSSSPSNPCSDFILRLSNVAASIYDPSDPSHGGDACTQLIMQIASKRYGEARFRSLIQVLEEFDVGLKACQQEEYSTAKSVFDSALPKISTLLGESRVLAETLSYPKIALYYYRTSCFPPAIALLQRVIRTDDILEPAFPCLHIHKLHQLHNISRIYFAQSNDLPGPILIKKILAYLISGEAPAPHGCWGTAYLKIMSEYTSIDLTFWYILTDTLVKCLTNPGLEVHVTSQLHELSTLLIQQFSTSGTIAYKAVFEWLELKVAVSQNDLEGFEDRVITYLERYSNKYDTLKVLLLKHVITVLAKDYEETEKLMYFQQFRSWADTNLSLNASVF